MSMKTFIINYKAYEEAFTKEIEIARASAEISKKKGVDIIVSPPFTELRETSKIAKTIAQGIDEVEPGAFTAHITWYEVKSSGAVGTLLNHSEERYSYSKGGGHSIPRTEEGDRPVQTEWSENLCVRAEHRRGEGNCEIRAYSYSI